MIGGIQLKVCGLTSLVDADFADRSGADYLGFILHPASPRHVTTKKFRAMAPSLPDRRKVAVFVEPAPAELAAASDAGFDRYQIHFRHTLPIARIEAWSLAVGVQRLWLAPKLPPGVDVPEAWLPLTNTFLMDTFQPDGFGGSGVTGDWPKFTRHRRAHPGKTWILAGGLDADCIGDALADTRARFVDVNSGVESSPGVKDHAKLKAFVAALRDASGGSDRRR